MRKIKLIALDLDGTLLTSDRRISPGATEAVREALAQGVKVCLASGRALNTMLPYARELGLDGPIVSCNGAYVLGEGLIEIHHRTLGPTTRDKVLEYASERSIHTNLYVGGKVFFSSDGEWADLYRRRTGIQEEGVVPIGAMAEMTATKVLFIDRAGAVLEHRAATLNLLGSEEATVTLSEPEYIEFLPPGIDKSVGLQAAARDLNLDRSEVAALGDYLNDLEMIQWAGLSGAVANARPEVIEQADLLVASNDEGGAAQFVQAALAYRA